VLFDNENIENKVSLLPVIYVFVEGVLDFGVNVLPKYSNKKEATLTLINMYFVNSSKYVSSFPLSNFTKDQKRRILKQ